MHLRLLHVDGAGNIDLAVILLHRAGDHLAAGGLDRRPDSAFRIAGDPVVAGVVEDGNLLRSGLQAAADHAADQLRIRVRAAFGRTVPADVRFDDHALTGLDESGHAAEEGDSGVEHFSRRISPQGDQIRRFPLRRRLLFRGGRISEPPGDPDRQRKRGGPLQKIPTIHPVPPHNWLIPVVCISVNYSTSP